MTVWLFIGGLAATTFLVRLGGVVLAARGGRKADSGTGMVALLPVALLAAVAATQVVPKGHLEPHLLAAAVAAGLASTRLGFLPAVLVGGAAGALVSLI
ncbi:AzlD domain-containing protein [Microtetraspora malaysiensis]|uniref:AzlD domain-containing protein n=1 Tax=Microtetraspora malaysiensis TaxID=161358 RepID=UPI003D8D21C3